METFTPVAIILFTLVSVECVHVPLQGKRQIVPIIADILDGSTAADLGEFPNSVSVQSLSCEHICGGSLIDALHILTAASCLVHDDGQQFPPNTIQVMCDDNSVGPSGSPSRQTRHVVQIFVHPQYSAGSRLNDVAVIRLDMPFTTTDTCRPLRLAEHPPELGTQCQLASWRDIGAGQQLQHVSVEVLTEDACDQLIGNGQSADGKRFCAAPVSGNGGYDSDDTGTGLICGGLLTGVASIGGGSAKPNLPVANADVSAHLQFVLDAQMWQYDDDCNCDDDEDDCFEDIGEDSD